MASASAFAAPNSKAVAAALFCWAPKASPCQFPLVSMA